MIGNYYLLVEIKNAGTENGYLNIKAVDLYNAISQGNLVIVFYSSDGNYAMNFVVLVNHDKSNSTYSFILDNQALFVATGDNSFPSVDQPG